MPSYRLTDFLPTTKREMELRGWEKADVILLSGDAYVDHPSFGAAVIGRTIEALGLHCAIIPQPSWHGDFRDFSRIGRPRLFFGIAPGAMDSMVNKYTANRRLRSEDAYSPDGRHDLRPEYPTIVYSEILRKLYPEAPIVIGGIEASLRRLSHYDYWKEMVRPSILVDSGADCLVYGMGELPMTDLCQLLANRIAPGEEASAGLLRHLLREQPVRQTATLEDDIPPRIWGNEDIELYSHEEVVRDKRKQAENFRHIEEESNRLTPARIVQRVAGKYIVVQPPYPPMTTEQLDAVYALPYTRLPHPKYQGKRIPAYDMIKHSVNIHRGCFGGCAFCTISAHQGKFIASRSKESILREVKQITEMDDFKGYLSDLGGPSANMYRMGGRDRTLCARCRRPSCLHPQVCRNLNTDHRPLLQLYEAVNRLPGLKKSFIGSGVRYDLILHRSGDEDIDQAARDYARCLIARHVSGRLKVAPEHTAPRVLQFMRKPSFDLFRQFKELFDRENRRAGLNQQLIPYFISSHPGCTEEDMAELAALTREMDFHLEQVQDFTPTPMTVSTEAWYTGLHPYTLRPVYSARNPQEKLRQRMFFFWYKPEERRKIEQELRRMRRPDLLEKLYPRNNTRNAPPATPRSSKPTQDEKKKNVQKKK